MSWEFQQARAAIRMAKAGWSDDLRHMRIIWQERAADYRECLVYQMRRRQGWSLAHCVAADDKRFAARRYRTR